MVSFFHVLAFQIPNTYFKDLFVVGFDSCRLWLESMKKQSGEWLMQRVPQQKVNWGRYCSVTASVEVVVSVTVIDEHLPDVPHDGLAAPQLGQVEGGVVESLKEHLRHLATLFSFPPIIQDCHNLWSYPHQVFRNILINIRMGLGWLCRTWEESSQSNEVPPNAEVGHPLTFLYSFHFLLPIHVATLQQKVASYIFSATQPSTVKRNSMLVPCPIF